MSACLPRRMSWELAEGYRFDCQYFDIPIAIGLIVILSLSKYWQSNHLLRQPIHFYLSTDK